MGKHIFTISIRSEFESPAITDGESNRTLTLPPHILHGVTTTLRNELFDLETMSGEDFQEILPLAANVNNVLLEIENLIQDDEDDDDDDD